MLFDMFSGLEHPSLARVRAGTNSPSHTCKILHTYCSELQVSLLASGCPRLTVSLQVACDSVVRSTFTQAVSQLLNSPICTIAHPPFDTLKNTSVHKSRYTSAFAGFAEYLTKSVLKTVCLTHIVTKHRCFTKAFHKARCKHYQCAVSNNQLTATCTDALTNVVTNCLSACRTISLQVASTCSPVNQCPVALTGIHAVRFATTPENVCAHVCAVAWTQVQKKTQACSCVCYLGDHLAVVITDGLEVRLADHL